MRYCVECHHLLTMEELIWRTGGMCFDCFWPAPTGLDKRLMTHEQEAEYWRFDEAMEND